MLFRTRDFLNVLNGHIECRGQTPMLVANGQEDRGLTILPEEHPTRPRLSFTNGIEGVWIGGCGKNRESISPMISPLSYRARTVQLAECSIIRMIIKSYGSPRHILVVPECHGGYPPAFQELLRSALPEITWHFVDVDLLSTPLLPMSMLRLATKLVHENILQAVAAK